MELAHVATSLTERVAGYWVTGLLSPYKAAGFWVAIPVHSSRVLGYYPRPKQRASGLLSPSRATGFWVANPVQSSNQRAGCDPAGAKTPYSRRI